MKRFTTRRHFGTKVDPAKQLIIDSWTFEERAVALDLMASDMITGWMPSAADLQELTRIVRASSARPAETQVSSREQCAGEALHGANHRRLTTAVGALDPQREPM